MVKAIPGRYHCAQSRNISVAIPGARNSPFNNHGVVNYSSHSKNIKQIAANTPNLLRTNWKELTIEAQVGRGKIPPSPKRPQGYH